ncbi:hypothetical protein EsH8_I_000762 [Colletotrichum jinshuiense]
MAMTTGTKAECWIWYALAITSVILRYSSHYIVRKRKFFNGMTVDDIVMIFVVCVYTIAIASLYIYFDTIDKTDFDHLTPEGNAAVGRKLGILNILAETAIQTTLWGNKCCLLLLYNRLTLFGHYIKLWIIVSTYTGLAYIGVMIALYGGWCRPFSQYLTLLPTNLECLTWWHYNIFQLTMNLSTDLILLLVPITLISGLNMKIGKKLLLICLFSMGVFVMLCAILTKVAVFSNSVGPVWFLWSVREGSTAMLVGNLVLSMPAIRACFRPFIPGSETSTSGTSGTSGTNGTKKTAKYSEGSVSEPASSTLGSPVRGVHGRPPDVESHGKEPARNASRRLSTGQESV